MPTIVWNDPTETSVTFADETIAQVTVAGASVLDGLTDVVITSPSNGQALTYDSATQTWKNASGAGSGTVTSVAVSGSDGIEVDSGSPVTSSGTIALGINATNLLAHIGVEAGATADQTGAEIKALYEGEADTNAYTDAEKAKVANLITGANKLNATAAPTANDDAANTSGNGVFSVGSLWVDVTNDEAYRCVDATATAAIWVKTTLDTGELAAVALSGQFGDLVGSIATSQITNKAVTLAKMDDMATASLLGRNTGGAGVPEVLGASTVRSLLGLVPGTDVQAYNANTRTIKDNLAASAAPTADDDTGDGYAVGSFWLDTTADKAYVCLDATSTAAVWRWISAIPGADVLNATNPSITGSVTETVYAISGTTPALEPDNGTIQTWTLSDNSTPTDAFSAGQSMTLMVDDGTAYTITWPTMTWLSDSGAAPTLQTTGYTLIVLFKVGSTLYGFAGNGA